MNVHDYLCRLLAPENLPNLLLVIVGVITFISIRKQAVETAKATKAMQDSLPLQKASADAALANAKAVVNSERPWIFIEIEKSANVGSPRKANVKIFGKNNGRTPAEVTVMTCEFAFLPEANFPYTTYPDEPVYPQTELTYKNYVAAGKTFDVYSFDCSSCVTDETWQEMKGQRLTFTGHVVYQDLITGDKHETRFCYFLSPVPMVGLIQCGPRNYNQHT
jgi:hypothetical protein